MYTKRLQCLTSNTMSCSEHELIILEVMMIVCFIIFNSSLVPLIEGIYVDQIHVYLSCRF